MDKSVSRRNGGFILALNSAALKIQQVKGSEESVLALVTEQIAQLGLRGGLGFLNETGKKINILSLAQHTKNLRLLRHLESITGIESRGFEISIDKLEVLAPVFTENQVVLVENTQEILLDVLPDTAKQSSRFLESYFPPLPGIFAPLIRDDKFNGVLYVSGEGLTKEVLPVIHIFANHVSIALENAHLISSLKDALQSKDFTESMFRSLIDQSPLSTVTYTPDGKTIYGNQASLDLWRISEEVKDLIYKNYNILEDEQLENLGILEDVKRGFQGESIETDPIKYDPTATDPNYIGPVRWLKANVYPVRDNKDTIKEVVVIHEDITERVTYQQALVESEERLRSLVDNVSIGIYRTSISPDEFIQANPALLQIFGYESFEELLQIPPSSFYTNPDDRISFLKELESKGYVKDKDLHLTKKDGSELWVRLNTTANFGEDGNILWLDGVLEDITDKKRTEDQLQFEAFHDPLTKLPNRALFIDRLSQAFGRSKRRENYLYAVLFLDLDRFKIINDSLGHEIGDIALSTVGKRLLDCVRAVDTVARFSGDEFIILLDEINSMQNAIDITNRMLPKLEEPMKIRDKTVQVTGSFGIAFHSDKYQTPSEIIRDADIAMYRAKATGKNRYEIFDNTMLELVMDRIRIESEMRKGLDRDQFVVNYQPLINLDNMNMIGFESLVRWDHPEKGILPPDYFLSIAEETGMIIDLGKIVIRIVSDQLCRWVKEIDGAADLQVSINLSVKQFLHQDILRDISTLLKETPLTPQNIKIEITESSIMDDSNQSLAMIQEYRSLGIEILLDDFGTGFSSLSRLHQYSFDGIKIDKSFINNLNYANQDENFVKTIIALGINLNMDVYAEGIEKNEQLEILRGLNCTYGQGYLISYPLGADEAEDLLKDRSLIPEK